MEHPKPGYVWTPRNLHTNIKRGHYPIKTLDELLPLLHGKMF